MLALHRIDLLLDQPADELLDAAVDLAIEQRRRHVERDARGELAQQVAARSRARPRASPRARGRRAPASRSASSDSNVAEILRELVVERRHDALADRLDRHVVGDRRARRAPGSRSRPDSCTSNVFGSPGLEADQRLVEAGRVGRGADVDRHVRRGGRSAVRRRGSPASSSAVAAAVRLRSMTTESPVLDAAALDRLVARRPLAQARQRLVHGRVVDRRLPCGAASGCE